MVREIKEEMCFTPEGYQLFKKFITFYGSANAFCLKVDDGFEKKVTIMEGDYGKFFSEQEVINEAMMMASDKDIVRELYDFLRQKQ